MAHPYQKHPCSKQSNPRRAKAGDHKNKCVNGVKRVWMKATVHVADDLRIGEQGCVGKMFSECVGVNEGWAYQIYRWIMPTESKIMKSSK